MQTWQQTWLRWRYSLHVRIQFSYANLVVIKQQQQKHTKQTKMVTDMTKTKHLITRPNSVISSWLIVGECWWCIIDHVSFASVFLYETDMHGNRHESYDKERAAYLFWNWYNIIINEGHNFFGIFSMQRCINQPIFW